MYQQNLDKIIAMVKMSEAFDQTGYVEESLGMLYNAFELAEQTTYKIAEKIENDMTKTASKNPTSDIDLMTKSAFNWAGLMKNLGKGIGEYGEELGKNLVGKQGLGLIDKAKLGLGQGAKNLGREMEGKALRTGPLGLFKAKGDRAFGKQLGAFIGLRDPAIIEQRLMGMGVADQNLARDIASRIANTRNPQEVYSLLKKSGLDDAALGVTREGLTSGAKLGLGLGGVATGAGALSALNRGNNQQTQTEGGIGTAETPVTIPSTGSSGGVGSTGTTSGGAAASQISSIEQRMNNLEQVVNAIRAKVGV